MSETLAGQHSEIRLFDPETLVNPYPAYKQMRDTAPVYYLPEMNLHVVTRYDLLRQAIVDTETFSSRYDSFLQQSQKIMFESASPEVQAELLDLAGQMVEVPPTMLTLDEPDHTKYRSLVNQLFTVSRIRAAEPAVQAVIDKTIEGFGEETEIEFVERFAFPVPLTIIAERLGIPEADREFFDDAATAAAAALRLTPLSGEEMVRRAKLGLDLQKLLIGLVEARREDPQDDMITILATSKLQPEDRYLTHGETLGILNQFLVAGHETTASTFAWGMLIMCQNPGLEDELRAEPKLMKTFIEEALRLESPVQGLPRLVTKDTELDGYPLKAGDMIMLRYGAANRDERKFEDPDVCDLHRSKAGAQMAFGSGVHACIGAPLARQELSLGFPALLRHAKNYRLDPSKPQPEAEASFILRNLPYLHIQFDRLS